MEVTYLEHGVQECFLHANGVHDSVCDFSNVASSVAMQANSTREMALADMLLGKFAK